MIGRIPTMFTWEYPMSSLISGILISMWTFSYMIDVPCPQTIIPRGLMAMGDRNLLVDLETVVGQMLSGPRSADFKRYWELYKEIALISDPKGIYFRISQDASYRNLVIAGQAGIVDIETEESSIDSALSFTPYSSFSGVIFRFGFIPSLPNTEGSLLTVVCRVSGTTSLGHYWCAQDEEEVNRLRSFAKILANEVSSAKRADL